MKISQIYSHLNGLEFLQIHKTDLWGDIQASIQSVKSAEALTKISNEKTMRGRMLFSPKDLNLFFRKEFEKRRWTELRTSYFVNEDLETTRDVVDILDKQKQKNIIISHGFIPYSTYNQVDFIKGKVAVEIQFGKYFSVQYDLHVKHTFFYNRGEIDVGVEIIPMHDLMSQMSSGVPWYENELTNIVREGRANPAVPIVLIGISPD